MYIRLYGWQKKKLEIYDIPIHTRIRTFYPRSFYYTTGHS